MFKKSAAVLGMVLILFAVVTPANAQSCVGTGSCTVTTTASVTIPALVSLTVAGAGSITLTAPTTSSLGSYVANNGPAISVKANRTWTLAVHTTADPNWGYAGDFAGKKPIGDLTWSTAVDGTFTAITNAAANLVTNQAATNAGSASIFFRTHYAAAYDDESNQPGTYSIPLVFTLSAP